MPAKVKIKILSCKNLPIMDRQNQTTDAFVEVKLGNITYKTDVKRKSLNPVFNSQWFRFEIDDQEIQDEVLQIKIMDYDTYSANDAIGKVCLSLNPLLLQNDSKGFSGYIPIYDTMNGIRGEINFMVKVELFSDSNKFRQSSCGIQFFHTNAIPFGYHAVIRGFVEEMIVDDDPEHDWIDKIRRASASNEARQQTFMRLAGQIQRKIGLKAISLGGNAVIGFQQRFDLEKDTIIARGIGTCVLLVKMQSEQLNTSGVQNIPEDEKLSKFASSRSFTKLETIFDEQFLRKASLEAEQSKSLLSVPSIYVDSVDGTSTISTNSTNFDSSSINDDKRSVLSLETVSMIVRNVEAYAEQELEAQKVSPKTKHDFLNELKEKFHHLGNKKKEGFHDVAKKKEILHDLKENVSEKFHQIAEKIHHIHLPHLHHHETEESLIAQAMQTILLEKFNIVEASSGINPSTSSDTSGGAKRKTSASSLQSIKQKFNLFQRPRRSVDLPNETSSLKSISEINSQANNAEKVSASDHEENLSIDELKIHDDTCSEASFESTITVLPSSECLKAVSKEDLMLSVQNFDLFLKTNSHGATFAETNKQQPLHESLLSLSRNELLSASPNVKTHARTESFGCKMIGGSPSKQQQQQQCGSLPTKDASSNICRRSSDSDLSITPKGNSLTPGNLDRNAMKIPSAVLKPNQDNSMDSVLEYPFLTLTKYPPGFIIHIGATVSARSVKLLDKSTNPEDMETRDSWFNELRMEIRGHAKSLGCNVVLGYTETATINDDVSVLSASGTAAVINLNYVSHEDGEFKIPKTGASINPKELLLTTSVEETIQILEENVQKIVISAENGNNAENEKINGEDANNDVFNTSGNTNASSGSNGISHSNYCSLYHIPYSRSSVQIGGANIGKCCLCKRGYVPDVILATIELPESDGPSVIGTGTLIQATVCRPKRDLRSESNAKEISDALPFLEYELHRLLINKLKVKGMNAIFRLSVQVSIGDKIMSLIATGTAVYLAALHPPVVPKIVAGNSFNESSDKLAELQKTIQNTVERNRERYQLTNQTQIELTTDQVQKLNKNFSDTEDSDNEEKLDYAIGNKQTCILEIDDIQDLELYSMLTEQYVPEGINIVNAQNVPGQQQNVENMRNFQTFVQVWRTKLASSHQSNSNFARHFQRLLQSIFFKLRFAVPCHICNLQFQLDLPADEIQLLITGLVLKTATIGSKSKNIKIVQSISHDKKLDDELMFSLEEEEIMGGEIISKDKSTKKGPPQFNNHTKITSRNDKFIDISPLSFVPGAKVEKYLGNLNFCFIRETQNVRDYGGICGFVHSFISELLAIMRAHISALGGNMMLAFYMTELILIDNPHKNQAQLLINSGGDAVYCTYPLTDDN